MELIWITVIFLVFLAFYALYNPLFRRDIVDELVAGFGTVGMIFLALIWSNVAFSNMECSDGLKFILVMIGAVLIFFGLLAAMMLVAVIWGCIVSLFFPKHAEKLF